MKSKIPAINLLIIVITSLFLILTFISCSPRITDKIDVTEEESEGISEEEVKELEEEVVDVVDYESAQVGAEIKGYIPSFLCTDSDNYIKIEITNTSDFTWRSSGENMVRIGYHYYGQDVENSQYIEYNKATRTILPYNVEPGENAEIEVLINDITHKGIYVLQIDLVLEGFYWFSAKDVPMLEGRTYFGSCTD
ncbi:MAG: hypothetical protein KKG62_04450 [Actinobacteria bacterium]|nr:hypothetical protein [Actinomycetota bacterium]